MFPWSFGGRMPLSSCDSTHPAEATYSREFWGDEKDGMVCVQTMAVPLAKTIRKNRNHDEAEQAIARFLEATVRKISTAQSKTGYSSFTCVTHRFNTDYPTTPPPTFQTLGLNSNEELVGAIMLCIPLLSRDNGGGGGESGAATTAEDISVQEGTPTSGHASPPPPPQVLIQEGMTPDLCNARIELLIFGTGSRQPDTDQMMRHGDTFLSSSSSSPLRAGSSWARIRIPIFFDQVLRFVKEEISLGAFCQMLDLGLSDMAVLLAKNCPYLGTKFTRETISQLVADPPHGVMCSPNLTRHLDRRLDVVATLGLDAEFAMACEKQEAAQLHRTFSPLVERGRVRTRLIGSSYSFWKEALLRSDDQLCGLELVGSALSHGLVSTAQYMCRARFSLAGRVEMEPMESQIFSKALETQRFDARAMDDLLMSMSDDFKVSPMGGGTRALRALLEMMRAGGEENEEVEGGAAAAAALFSFRRVIETHFPRLYSCSFFDVLRSGPDLTFTNFITLVKAWIATGRDFQGTQLLEVLSGINLHGRDQTGMSELMDCIRDDIVAHGCSVDEQCLTLCNFRYAYKLARLTIIEHTHTPSPSPPDIFHERARALSPVDLELFAIEAIREQDLDAYAFFAPMCRKGEFESILKMFSTYEWSDDDNRRQADEAALAIVAHRHPGVLLGMTTSRSRVLCGLCRTGLVRTVEHIVASEGFCVSHFEFDLGKINVPSPKPEPLQNKLRNDVMACLELLLRSKFDPNRGFDTRTPLHVAAAYGDVEYANLLLRYGANPDLRSTECHTPLVYALRYMREDVANLLFSRMRPVDVQEALAYLDVLWRRSVTYADEPVPASMLKIVTNLCSCVLRSGLEDAGDKLFPPLQYMRLTPELRSMVLNLNLQLSVKFVRSELQVLVTYEEYQLRFFIDILNTSHPAVLVQDVDPVVDATTIMDWASEMNRDTFRGIVRWMEPKIETYSPEDVVGCLPRMRYAGYGQTTGVTFIMNVAHFLRIATRKHNSRRPENIYQIICDHTIINTSSYTRRAKASIDRLLLLFGLMGVQHVSPVFVTTGTDPSHVREMLAKGRLLANLRTRTMSWMCWNQIVESLIGAIPDEFTIV